MKKLVAYNSKMRYNKSNELFKTNLKCESPVVYLPSRLKEVTR